MKNDEKQRFFVGKIVDVNGTINTTDPTQNLYRCDDTSYVIDAALPGQAHITRFQGQVPEIRLWPDTMFLDGAGMMNKTVLGCLLGNDVIWMFAERPLMSRCPNQPGTGGMPPPGALVQSESTPIASDGDTGTGPGAGGANANDNPGEV